MGLDQYLRAKTNIVKQIPSRGACNGLFHIAPADRGTTEIGYWRKAYSVSYYLKNILNIEDDFNLEDKEISYDQIVEIINYANNVLLEKTYYDQYEKNDWKEVVNAFSKAKEILDIDDDASIYYMEWY